MGEQQKKFNGWRLGILSVVMAVCCLMMTAGFALLDSRRSANSMVENFGPAGTGNTSDSDIYWIDSHSGYLPFTHEENTYHITTAADLAELNYRLTKSEIDYSGSIFILDADIKLNKIQFSNNSNRETTPLWTPIELGTDKNQNITFNGNGYSIEGMTIKINSDTAQNVGFFAEMMGGVFENVTFKNPVITYDYTGNSIAANSSSRLDKPVEVCVGVIAGVADTTYVNNVTIENPTVTFNTENSNGHNFYVGTAVGKSIFTSHLNDKDKSETINTVTPTQWGLDTVNVVKNDSESTGVTMKIKAGTRTGVTYGQATNGYLGGLVGLNLSSKIINSTLLDCFINPELDANMAGTYSVGGLAGMTTQIATDEKLLVASGLYNNLLSNVTIGEIGEGSDETSDGKYYGGKLVGRAYSGGWIYNNVIFGAMAYDLWGQLYNSQIYLVTDPACIGHLHGAVDEYYLKGKANSTYPNCLYGTVTSDGETYTYCSVHQGALYNYKNKDNYGTDETMRKYNFCFTAYNVGLDNDQEYQDFITKTVDVTVEDEANPGKTKIEQRLRYDMLSYYNGEEGYMYHAALPIVAYETGLTVNEKNENNTEAEYEKRVEAIYQFRTWTLNEARHKELRFGGYYGADLICIFDTKSPGDNYDAYFEVENKYGYIEAVHELNQAYTYQQFITDPSEEINLVCEGFEFLGWKLYSPKYPDIKQELTSEEIKGYQRLGYYSYSSDGKDENCYYVFGKQRITESGYRFYANWKRKTYTVTFMNGDKEFYTEEVSYDSAIYGKPNDETPKSTDGRTFVGWFLAEDLPQKEHEDANASLQWVLGNDGNKMPSEDLVLYAGWVDKFTELNELLNNSTYADYYENAYLYFQEKCAVNFHNAYDKALEAREGKNVDANQLLINLQSAISALRVEPKNLLGLVMFDETSVENTCPFLYNYTAYLSYDTYKKTVKNYIETTEGDDLKNIDAFIKHYEYLMKVYNDLKDNLTGSVVKAGGLESNNVKQLIEKYNTLQNESENKLNNAAKYDSESLTMVEDAKSEVDKLWNSTASDVDLKDVENAITVLENAIKDLKPRSVTNEGGNDNNNANKKSALPISPVLLGVLIVLVLMAGAGGYVGVDIVLNKRRMAPEQKVTEKATAKQVKTPAAESAEEEEDTYI
ncbi:MAG: hypothetical protein NC133_01595 [Prevotella sp.]|nr:hypothetical protein [Prevotella sp.]